MLVCWAIVAGSCLFPKRVGIPVAQSGQQQALLCRDTGLLKESWLKPHGGEKKKQQNPTPYAAASRNVAWGLSKSAFALLPAPEKNGSLRPCPR